MSEQLIFESEPFEFIRETGTEYQEIVRRIQGQLQRNFSSPNDLRLIQRREELRRIFGSVPASRAKTLYDQLQKPSDPFGRLFRYRLATATRNEMLGILRNKIATAPAPSPSSQSSPRQPDVHDVVLNLLTRNAPLPASLEPEFHQAAQRLNSILSSLDRYGSKLSQNQTQSLFCILSKLLQGGDDRVILWGEICPAKFINFQNNMCVFGFRPMDQDLFFRYIKSKSDVEKANEQLHFIHHLKTEFLNMHLVYKRGAERGILEQLLVTIAHINITTHRLAVMLDPNLAPSSRPVYCRAIKDWIAEQESNPNSVYAC